MVWRVISSITVKQCCLLSFIILFLLFLTVWHQKSRRTSEPNHTMKFTRPHVETLDMETLSVPESLSEHGETTLNLDPNGSVAVKSTAIITHKNEVIHPIRIAYIFAGSARSFICPKVHWSLRLNVIDAFGGEPYVFVRVSEEDNMNTRTGKGRIWSPQYGSSELNETLKILNPRKVQYFRLSEQEEEMKRNFPETIHRVFRENDLRRYSMFYHRCMGYRLAREWEEEHGMRFDWVALIRLDAAWLEPVLPIQYYANDRVWLTETGYVPLNDQFMLIPRQYSDYLYDLNTKVRKEVYCLGGPDVEKWKCNATELAIRGKSETWINETLSYCCEDRLTLDNLGYSETIHYRHLQFGKIPVSMGRFAVYISRYYERPGKGPKAKFTVECYGDCPRLHYHFKDARMDVLQNSYPYWKKWDAVDTRQLPIDITDSGKCGYITNPAFHWRPITASELHRQQVEAPNASDTLSLNRTSVSSNVLDYGRNFYEQWDQLHPSLKLNPIEFNIWQIHPTTTVDACLTYSFLNKTLDWHPCIHHIRLKAGRRRDAAQTFHLLVNAYDPSSFYKHPLLKDDDVVMAFHKLPLPARTRVAILDREQLFLDLRKQMLCLTIAGNQPRLAEMSMEPCAMNDNDPRQWFFTVNGTTMGSHDHSLIGTLRSYQFPDHCVMRSSTKEMGVTNGVKDSKLRLGECKDNQPVQPDLMRFEFVMIQP